MFVSDAPIKSSNDDSLNRIGFVSHLAEAILQYDTKETFCIGLYGKWGSGKTSILNMLNEELRKQATEKRKEITIMRFNPWVFSDQNQLISQFFNQLATKIEMNSKGKNLESLSSLLRVWGSSLDFLSQFPQFGILARLGSIIIGTVKHEIDKSINSHKGNLEKIKDEIVTELSNLNSKIIVFIDDIDRLNDQEIRIVFQLVKSIADFPNTIYILAFDRNIVAKALCRNGCDMDDGIDYLEKIIQVQYVLPEIRKEDVSNIFLKLLDRAVDSVEIRGFNKERWSYAYRIIHEYLFSLRDAKRLINLLKLKITSLINEIDFIDLTVLTMLEFVEPEVISRLRLYKEPLCGSFNNSINYSVDTSELKDICSLILGDLSNERRVRALSFLSCLFPKIQDVFSNDLPNSVRYFKNRDYKQAQQSGSIYISRFFDRYFDLYINEDISLNLCDSLILQAKKSSVLQSLDSFNERGLLSSFFEYIRAYLYVKVNKFSNVDESEVDNSISSERAKILLECIMQKWETFKTPATSGSFDIPLNCIVDFVLSDLLQVLHENERINFMCDMFRRIDISISTIFKSFQYFKHEQERTNDENYNSLQEALFSKANFMKVEEIFHDRLKKAINEETLCDEEEFPHIASYLKKTYPEICETYYSSLLNTEIGFVKFIASKGKDVRINDVPVVEYEFDDMENYGGINEIYNRLINFLKSTDCVHLTQKQRENLGVLMILHEQKDNNLNLEGNISRKKGHERIQQYYIKNSHVSCGNSTV